MRAPDILVSSRKQKLDLRRGYIECKDIGIDLRKEEKTEQIKNVICRVWGKILFLRII